MLILLKEINLSLKITTFVVKKKINSVFKSHFYLILQQFRDSLIKKTPKTSSKTCSKNQRYMPTGNRYHEVRNFYLYVATPSAQADGRKTWW